MGLTEDLTSGDKKRAYEALLAEVAAKLDAGICRTCGGPRGEAAGMASLMRQGMKILEALDALPKEQEDSHRDQLAKRRADRRRRAAAQNPLDSIRDHLQQRP
jgi:hypothetical protein